MSAQRITEYEMDIHAEPIAEHASRHPQHPIDFDKYAALGGMRPGMVAGPMTGMPIPAPEPRPESTWHALRHGWFAAAGLLGFVALLAVGLFVWLAATGRLS